MASFFFNLRSRLNNCFNKRLPQCNIKVIFQSKNCLSNRFWFKDSIPKELRSHIVYKFLCSNCNITYYGKTERHLNVRPGEHLSLLALPGRRVNNNRKLAVKDHCFFLITWILLKIFQFWRMSQTLSNFWLKKHY